MCIIKNKFQYMKQIVLHLCLVSLFSLSASFGKAQSRGDLVSSELVRLVPQDTIREILSQATTGIPSFIINLIAPVRRDVEIHKLIYWTVAPDGSLVKASGGVYVPKDYPCRATLLTYLHGTITADRDAPSNGISEESAIGFVYAANARYITILPDYLGLGERGEGTLPYHPYQHAATAASASIDMMRAAKTFIQQNGLRINDQQFLLGYSQGGHAVLSTLRELQTNSYPGININYSVAGSGPYDLSGVQKNFVFANDVYENPSFFPYILQSYQPIYGNIFNDPSEIFNPGFENILDVFDGTLNVDQIDTTFLTNNWKSIFRPEYLQSVEFDPNNTTTLALQDNNVIDWAPRSELRLYYCNLDELVTIDNALAAWINFFLRGAGFRVSLASAGDFRHRECAPFVAFLSKIAFDSRRNNRFCLSLEAPQDEYMNESIPEEYQAELNRLRGIAEDKGIDEIQGILEEHGYFKVSELVELRSQDPESFVNFYPNPTEAKANLDLSKLPIPVSAVNVYDFTGRLIQSYESPSAQSILEIDGQSWKEGLYLVKVQTDAELLAQELSKELGGYARDLAYEVAKEVYTFKMLVK